MGCRHSSPTAPEGSSPHRKASPGRKRGWPLLSGSHRRYATLDARTKAALKQIIAARAAREEDNQASFNRIILKFPVLRKAFSSLRLVFNNFDVDGSGAIDVEELGACLTALGARLSQHDLGEMFEFANMTDSKALSFKEFIVCLAVGSVLQLFPLLKGGPPSGPLDADASGFDFSVVSGGDASAVGGVVDASGFETGPSASGDAAAASAGDPATPPATEGESLPSGSSRPATADTTATMDVVRTAPPRDALRGTSLYAQGQRLVRALKVVLEAYVLFDADGSGTIDRSEVLSMIDEEARKASTLSHAARRRGADAGGNALLSRERWMELDWDGDGSITFKEFLFAFMEWVGVDDDDDDMRSEAASTDGDRESRASKGAASFAAAAAAAAAGGDSHSTGGNGESRRPSMTSPTAYLDPSIDEALDMSRRPAPPPIAVPPASASEGASPAGARPAVRQYTTAPASGAGGVRRRSLNSSSTEGAGGLRSTSLHHSNSGGVSSPSAASSAAAAPASSSSASAAAAGLAAHRKTPPGILKTGSTRSVDA